LKQDSLTPCQSLSCCEQMSHTNIPSSSCERPGPARAPRACHKRPVITLKAYVHFAKRIARSVQICLDE
jgi:hypothetical protein